MGNGPIKRPQSKKKIGNDTQSTATHYDYFELNFPKYKLVS